MAETATDAIYRALRSPEPDPDLVHAAVEGVPTVTEQKRTLSVVSRTP